MAPFFETSDGYRPPSWVRYGFGTKAPLSYEGLSPEELETRKRESVAFAKDLVRRENPGFSALVTLTQRHTTLVQLTDSPHDEPLLRPVEADGLVCPQPGMAVAVKTADCLPILLLDESRPLVAAVHAGWRGTVDGIVTEAVKMLQTLGSRVEDLTALLGPCARVERYEVGEEVAERFRLADLQDAVRRDFGPKPHIDLPRANAVHLSRLGVNRVHVIGGCTLSEANAGRYDSWRRENARCGRMLSFIGILLQP